MTGRSVPTSGRNQSILGVTIDADSIGDSGPSIIQSSTFSSFDSSCGMAAAVGVGHGASPMWNCGNAVRALRFSTATKVKKLHVFPRTYIDGNNGTVFVGEAAKQYALRDLDGSLMVGKGYIVANSTNLLPPASFSPSCTVISGANAYACRNTCYRTVLVRASLFHLLLLGFFFFCRPAC